MKVLIKFKVKHSQNTKTSHKASFTGKRGLRVRAEGFPTHVKQNLDRKHSTHLYSLLDNAPLPTEN